MKVEDQEKFLRDFKHASKEKSFATLESAVKYSNDLIERAEKEVIQFAKSEHLDLAGLCILAVGSVGRLEALAASDLDIVPIATSAESLAPYALLDKKLRQHLAHSLNLKVSAGDNLTAMTTITDLTSTSTIGGENDSSAALTKRILILSESRQIAGKYTIALVRSEILKAYTDSDRTSGSHVLTLCNDIVRYFRTLCVEYKGRVDDEKKDWGTRNLKLRHSRKVWYFASMVSIAALVQQFPAGRRGYREALLETFDMPPLARLLNAVNSVDHHARVGTILDHYTWFLRFMETPANRQRLSQIDHAKRFDLEDNNPFPHLKLNSDLMHQAMVKLIYELPAPARDKVFDWFLL